MNTFLPAINRRLFVAGFISLFTLAPPAVLAQGDAFSAGDCFSSAKPYYVENSRTVPMPAGNRTTIGSIGANHPNTKTLPRFKTGFDPFAQLTPIVAGGDAFSETSSTLRKADKNPALKSYGDSLIYNSSNAHVLFNPQWDYSNQVKIIFYKPHINQIQIRQAMRDLQAPNHSYIKIASESLFTPQTSKTEILARAKRLEQSNMGRRLQYKIWNRKRLVASVYSEVPTREALIQLYVRAAQLETSVSQRHIYLGIVECFRKNWMLAWKHFERVYESERDNPEVARQIANAYSLHKSKELETCIWLTRFLRVARDWESFEKSYDERAAIETSAYGSTLDNEKGPNVAWDAKRFPLKLYFPDSQDSSYDKRLVSAIQEGFRSWSIATGAKIDFVEVSNPEQADVLCQWQQCPERYVNFNSSMPVPTGKLSPPELGLTFVEPDFQTSSSPVIKAATINIYANSYGSTRNISDETLSAVCLHEVGHALGIVVHLQEPGQIMYPFLLGTPTELTSADKKCISELYKSHPVIANASDKFIGMRAECKKAELPPEQISNCSTTVPPS